MWAESKTVFLEVSHNCLPRNLPGSPVVKTSSSKARGVGLIPGLGA